MIKNGAFFIILAGTLWGTTGIYSHLYQAYGLEPLVMSMLRVACAIVVMTPFMLRKGLGTFMLSRRGFAIAFIQGIMTQTIFNIAYFTAIGKLGMASSVVLLYTSPITVAILSYLFFKEKLTKRKVAAMCITVVGVAFTATGGQFDLNSLSGYGILMGLLAGFCYGTFSITSRLGSESDDPMSMTYYTMVFGFVGLVLYAGITGVQGFEADVKLAAISLISGSMSAAVPYFLFSIGISRLKEASYAPILSSSENIAAALFGYLLFHEFLGIWHIIGIALVIISIALINLPSGFTKK